MNAIWPGLGGNGVAVGVWTGVGTGVGIGVDVGMLGVADGETIFVGTGVLVRSTGFGVEIGVGVNVAEGAGVAAAVGSSATAPISPPSPSLPLMIVIKMEIAMITARPAPANQSHLGDMRLADGEVGGLIARTPTPQ